MTKTDEQERENSFATASMAFYYLPRFSMVLVVFGRPWMLFSLRRAQKWGGGNSWVRVDLALISRCAKVLAIYVN